MFKKAVKIQGIIAILALFMVFFAAAPAIFADSYGLSETAGNVSAFSTSEPSNVRTMVGQIIGTILSFVGLIFFGLIIYAGFMWMTAGGNDEKVHTAIELITQASFGLLVISAAYLITRFIGQSVITPLVQ